MPEETYNKIKKSFNSALLSKRFRSYKTIDMHTGGEPLRVIMEGLPEIDAKSVLEYRRILRDQHDYVRQVLMYEPRGHADMYGCVLTPPNDDTGDFGIVFLHNEGYSTMCGHAIIAISTLAVEMQWVEVKAEQHVLEIDAPCGRITSYVDMKDGIVESVTFHCVPSVVLYNNISLEVPNLGCVNLDLAEGGAFYADVRMEDHDFPFGLEPKDYRAIIEAGMQIKKTVIESNLLIEHPFETDLSFLYGTIFTQVSQKENIDSRNVCVFADGEVDRCPTGSGVAGRMAIHYMKDELAQGQKMRIESITDSVFEGSAIDTIAYNKHQAVIPAIKGTAYLTGIHEFLIDEHDPFQKGFFLR